MIHYPKRYWGLPLAFRWFGSPFPRTIPFVALSVGLTTALQLAGEWKRTIVDAFGHPYPFQVYAFVIGFLVVLRTNHALARFMEARGAVEQMQSKLADAALMLQAFDGVAGGDKKKTDDARRPTGRTPSSRGSCTCSVCCTRSRCSSCGATRTPAGCGSWWVA